MSTWIELSVTGAVVAARVPWVPRHPLRSGDRCLAPVLRTTLGAKSSHFHKNARICALSALNLAFWKKMGTLGWHLRLFSGWVPGTRCWISAGA